MIRAVAGCTVISSDLRHMSAWLVKSSSVVLFFLHFVLSFLAKIESIAPICMILFTLQFSFHLKAF